MISPWWLVSHSFSANGNNLVNFSFHFFLSIKIKLRERKTSFQWITDILAKPKKLLELKSEVIGVILAINFCFGFL